MFETETNIFHPVSGHNKSEAISLQIEAAILGGAFKTEERLPSERILQNVFQVSRGVIREALRTLRQKGLLEAKKGAKGGYYIKELDINAAIDHLALMITQKRLPWAKLLEFHYAMDQAVLLAAISNATETEVAHLAELAERLVVLCKEAPPDLDQIGQIDKGLNLLMVEMSKNPFFEWIMRTVQVSFRAYEFVVYEDPALRLQIAHNWQKTAQAIAAKNIQKALGLYGHWYVTLEQCLLERFGGHEFNALTSHPVLDLNEDAAMDFEHYGTDETL